MTSTYLQMILAIAEVKQVPVRTLQNRPSVCGGRQDSPLKICFTLCVYLSERAKLLRTITCRDVLLSAENLTSTTFYQAQDATNTTHS